MTRGLTWGASVRCQRSMRRSIVPEATTVHDAVWLANMSLPGCSGRGRENLPVRDVRRTIQDVCSGPLRRIQIPGVN